MHSIFYDTSVISFKRYKSWHLTFRHLWNTIFTILYWNFFWFFILQHFI